MRVIPSLYMSYLHFSLDRSTNKSEYIVHVKIVTDRAHKHTIWSLMLTRIEELG